MIILRDLLIDGGVFSKTTEFALNGDAGRVKWGGLDGVEGRSALRIGIMVVVVEVTSTVVKPATRCVNQSGRIQRVYQIGQFELGVLSIANLTPAFVVDNPGDNTRIATVLANKQFKLSLELLLLFGIWKNVDYRAVVKSLRLAGPERWHILDDHETESIARLVKQSWLDFDLDMLSVRNRT